MAVISSRPQCVNIGQKWYTKYTTMAKLQLIHIGNKKDLPVDFSVLEQTVPKIISIQ